MICGLTIRAQQTEEPLFPVNGGGSTIYIDRTGKAVLTVPYAGGRFSEGLAPASVNGNVCRVVDSDEGIVWIIVLKKLYGSSMRLG